MGTKKTKIKKCPFCGGEAIIQIEILDYMHIECKKCFASSEWFKTKETAIKKWNRRVRCKSI